MEGRTYQDYVAEVTGEMARQAGHAAEFTGNHIGDAKGTRGFLHRGDVTFMIDGSGDLKVTIEAMDRKKSELTRTKVCNELGEAMENRNSVTAIAVVPTCDNSLMCFQPFQQSCLAMWVVVLPKEIVTRSDLLALEFTFRWAIKAVCAATKNTRKLDVDRMAKLASQIRDKLSICDQIKRQMRDATRSQENAAGLITRLEREVGGIVDMLIEQFCAEARGPALKEVPRS